MNESRKHLLMRWTYKILVQMATALMKSTLPNPPTANTVSHEWVLVAIVPQPQARRTVCATGFFMIVLSSTPLIATALRTAVVNEGPCPSLPVDADAIALRTAARSPIDCKLHSAQQSTL